MQDNKNKSAVGVDPGTPEGDHHIVTVQVDMTELVMARDEGGNMVFNPKAEQAIIKLLEIHKAASEALAFVQGEIARQGLEYNENFTSVVGDYLKANYSASGARYVEDKNNAPKHRKAPFWKKKVTYSVDAKAVEAYEIKHRGKLPVGIVKPARNKSIRFTVKGASDE